MIAFVAEKTGGSIRNVCEVLEVPRSSFYHAAVESEHDRMDQLLADKIEIIFREHRGRYGYRRIWYDLADAGLSCSMARVRRLMNQRGLRAVQPRRYVPRTSDGKAEKPSKNVLAEAPKPTRPNQQWAGDITFIAWSGGWLYLSVILDLYSRKVVGWTLSKNMRTTFVINSVEKAFHHRGSTDEPLLFHSDRGVQYGSKLFRKLLKKGDVIQSMSARGNPYDNAAMESFMGTLKRELIRGGRFESFKDAQMEIFEFIDGYYNSRRRHSSIGYQSPDQFEKSHYNHQK